jgi:hypothetical protein
MTTTKDDNYARLAPTSAFAPANLTHALETEAVWK